MVEKRQIQRPALHWRIHFKSEKLFFHAARTVVSLCYIFIFEVFYALPRNKSHFSDGLFRRG
jgi:hypothetical protein